MVFSYLAGINLQTYWNKSLSHFIKRVSNINKVFEDIEIKKVMKKKPISVDKNMLAVKALSIMNSKKITSLCVHQNNKKNITIGFIHIHTILNANIN